MLSSILCLLLTAKLTYFASPTHSPTCFFFSLSPVSRRHKEASAEKRRQFLRLVSLSRRRFQGFATLHAFPPLVFGQSTLHKLLFYVSWIGSSSKITSFRSKKFESKWYDKEPGGVGVFLYTLMKFLSFFFRIVTYSMKIYAQGRLI